MCRIFGLLDPRLSEHDRHRLGEATARILHHGGPDGRAYRVVGGMLIGGTRLAISDPADGWQPFTAEGVTVFYNGEIYNAPELRRGLRSNGAAFATRCDGEVLAPLFARHGAQAFRQLDGMFAIAAYEHSTGRLTLVRDQAGVKPLYAFAEDGRFGFASEIPALLRLRGAGVRVDADAVDRYLRLKAVYGAAPDPAATLGDPTMVDGIYALPPGHALEVTPGEHPRISAFPPVVAAYDDPVDALGRLLPGTVARMLPTDVPYCSVLSGGLDSTVVATLAAHAGGPPATFTVVPKKSSPYDELRYAQLVARTLGSPLEQVRIGGADLPELLPAVVRSLGQPNSDPIIVSTYRLFEAVRSAGYPVALTGDASDEFFGGYGRYRELAHTGDTAAYRDSLSGTGPPCCSVPYSADAKARLAELRRPDAGPWADISVSDGGPADSHRDAAAAAEASAAFERRHRLPVYHLQRVDHLSAAHSVEARLPFCRNDIIALGLGLRVDQKIGPDGAVKITLAQASARHEWAPAEVLNRPKQPFTFRLADHLLDEDAVAFHWARDVLTDPMTGRRGWFDRGRVEKLLTEFADKRTEPLAQAIWALLVLELWLHQIEKEIR
jgi:asparagine synthase (glutamine-hydrolysing)